MSRETVNTNKPCVDPATVTSAHELYQEVVSGIYPFFTEESVAEADQALILCRKAENGQLTDIEMRFLLNRHANHATE